jgi:hypothetical protein
MRETSWRNEGVSTCSNPSFLEVVWLLTNIDRAVPHRFRSRPPPPTNSEPCYEDRVPTCEYLLLHVDR